MKKIKHQNEVITCAEEYYMEADSYYSDGCFIIEIIED